MVFTWFYFPLTLTLASFLSAVAARRGDVRLNGGTHYKGRVEIQAGGRWGNVCDDYWTAEEGKVVCRQLGFLRMAQVIRGNIVSVAFGAATGSIFLDNLRCTGSEGNLFECPSSGFGNHNCVLNESAGVECINTNNIRLRKNGVIHPTEGFVEISVNGRWGKVCDDYWDRRSATVACRQLGLQLSMWNPSYDDRLTNVRYILDDVRCRGREQNLLDCGRRNLWTSNCGDDEAAAVKCI